MTRDHLSDLERIENRFADTPELLRLFPLLKAVILIDVQENETTSQMPGDARADNTRKLLAACLAQAAAEQPTVLIFDDAHWMDASSWSLLRMVFQELGGVMLVVAFRPDTERLRANIAELDSLPDFRAIKLDNLAAGEIASMLRRKFAVRQIAAPIVDAIYEHADGNAFFSLELGYALIDAGIIRVENDACEVSGDLAEFEFPATVEKVISGRVDVLRPELQLTLKVASVIGRIFDLQSLSHIHPIESDRPELEEYLETLADLELTPLHTPPPDQEKHLQARHHPPRSVFATIVLPAVSVAQITRRMDGNQIYGPDPISLCRACSSLEVG